MGTQSRQRAFQLCICGVSRTIMPTESPWEFVSTCPCGYDGTISWAHNVPPPIFEIDGQKLNKLRDEKGINNERR